jgi:hypothetical protein
MNVPCLITVMDGRKRGVPGVFPFLLNSHTTFPLQQNLPVPCWACAREGERAVMGQR